MQKHSDNQQLIKTDLDSAKTDNDCYTLNSELLEDKKKVMTKEIKKMFCTL
jgi:hypothetical protein